MADMRSDEPARLIGSDLFAFAVMDEDRVDCPQSIGFWIVQDAVD